MHGSSNHQSGKKIQDENDECWVEYPYRILGHPMKQIDNPEYVDALMWTCCDQPGSDEGCKTTRHKCKDNTILATAQDEGERDRVKQQSFAPIGEQCKYCNRRFVANDSHDTLCSVLWHSGEKKPDHESEFWADHDEACHGRLDDLVDEPDYADGMIWNCCDGELDSEGCSSRSHEAR